MAQSKKLILNRASHNILKYCPSFIPNLSTGCGLSPWPETIFPRYKTSGFLDFVKILYLIFCYNQSKNFHYYNQA